MYFIIQYVHFLTLIHYCYANLYFNENQPFLHHILSILFLLTTLLYSKNSMSVTISQMDSPTLLNANPILLSIYMICILIF